MRGSLDQIVEIAHAHEAKVNDVLPSNIAAVQHELGALAASTTAGTGRGR